MTVGKIIVNEDVFVWTVFIKHKLTHISSYLAIITPAICYICANVYSAHKYTYMYSK